MNKESLKFLRKHFKISARKKISWGIIEEKSDVNNRISYKPGVYIEDSNLFLDIAARRFYTANGYKKIYPATRKAERLCYRYTVKDNPELSIVRSKTYIADILYPTIYSKDLETEDVLL